MKHLLFRLLVACGMLLSTGAALAQPAPTEPRYYRVTGVAADDVLNIRAEPTASAEIVGELAPGASPVETLGTENGWARVFAGERMGWTHMNYLEPIQMSPVGDSSLPAGMSCSGTEPFWGLDVDMNSVTYNAVDAEEQVMDLVEAGGFAGRGPSVNFFVAAGENGGITAVVNDQMCSDGMSNRDYPRRIDVVLSGPDGLTGLTGCCHLPVN